MSGVSVFAQAPTITSFTPSAQTQGGTVTITGANFTGVTGVGAVKFGGTNATSFSVLNATTITAVVGAGTTGAITVTHPTNGTATSGTTFTFCGSVSQPGTVTGRTNVCGYTTLTYTIRKVTNATSYVWSLGTGSPNSFTRDVGAGPNDTSITITFNPTFCGKDTIYVRAATVCATSIVRSLPLNATFAPAAPVLISNTNPAVCIGSTTTLVAPATSPSATQSDTRYIRWTLPANTSMVSANADSTIVNISINAGFSGGSVTVRSQNACGVRSATGPSNYITYLPATPQSITSVTGSYAACVGNKIYFTALAGAGSSTNRSTASFRWTIPANTQILSANTDSSVIRLQFNTGYVGGSLRTTPVSACGRVGSNKIVNLTAGTCPTPPAAISGLQEICAEFNPITGYTGTLAYSVTPVPGAVKYNWVLPNGATQVSGDTTNSIGVVFDSTVLSRYGEGRIFVGTVNAAGIHSATYTELRIYKTKPILQLISGPADICAFIGKDTPITYTVPVEANVTSYVWNVPAGATLFSGQGTNTAQIKFTNSFINGSNISVTGLSNCGSNGPRPKQLLRIGIATTPQAIQESFSPSIPAVTNVAGLSSVTLRIQKVTNAERYQWRLRAGTNATLTHPNGAGINDTVVVVNFLAGFRRDIVSVAALSPCNTSLEKSVVLSALAVPPGVTSVSGELNPCRNSSHVYTATHAVATISQAPFDHFRWTIPPHAIVTASNADSSTITVQYDGSFVGGNLIACSKSVANVVSSVCKYLSIRRIPSLCAPGSRVSGKQEAGTEELIAINNQPLSISIYPNPTQKEFSAILKSSLPGQIEWMVLDMNGKQMTRQFAKPGELVTFGFAFPAGPYILRCTQGSYTQQHKLLKY